MALNPEQLPLSLSFLMNSSHASPKRLEVISEANQSGVKLMIPAFSTEFAMFSTGFSMDPWSLLRAVVFRFLPQSILTPCSIPVSSFKESLHDLQTYWAGMILICVSLWLT